MKNTTYKRGQLEWTLWRYFRVEPNENDTPPPIFSTRIKRLLELDRGGIDGAPGFAFSNFATSGRGSDAGFSPFDAFCLAVAMDLLDAGFKQSEIVFFLAHTRSSLIKEYKYILRHPLPPRQRVATKDYPDLPSYVANNVRCADGRVYMVTRKIELKEIFTNTQKKSPNTPLIQKPVFLHGIEKLTAELNANPAIYRKVTLVELSDPAIRITELLQKAPEIRRGRR